MRFFSFVFILTLAFSFSNAQTKGQKPPCYSHQATQQWLDAHPESREYKMRVEKEAAEFLKNNPNPQSLKSGASTFIIPVVVHIVHEYGPEYISNQQVHDAIDEMNRDFLKQNFDTVTVVSAFSGIIGNMDLEFRLATKDPNGNCTNGITRVFDPVRTNDGGCPGGSCNQAMPNAWPKQNYMNIWVVNDIASGAAAYSRLASSNVPTGFDGVVCGYQFFGTGDRTMTHESGHYLNLNHTWGPTNNQGLPSNCNTDDNIPDTPNCIGTLGGCNTSRTTCGTLDNIQNFMDYASCPVMFTQGQVNVMTVTLNVGMSQRDVLVSSANLIATGTDDATYANIPTCIPIAEFNSSSTLTCTGSIVNFRDRSYNGNAGGPTWSYNWSFPGGTPSSSTDRNPDVFYSGTGNYNVTLTVTNSAGTSTPEQKANYMEVLQGSGSFIAPRVDKISDSDWPENSDPSLEYTVNRPGGTIFDFDYTDNVSYSPPGCIFLNNFAFNNTGEHEIITPVMDLSNMVDDSTYLNFQVAHARRSTENEVMFLYSSTNCGASWELEKLITANDLVTVTDPSTISWAPSGPADWRFLSYDMSKHAGKPNVQFSFRFGASNGNNLYFDDIAISNLPEPEPLTSLNSEEFGRSFNIYPNPNEGVFNLNYYWDGKDGINLNMFDALGNTFEIKTQVKEGWNSERIVLSEFNIKPGIYFIRINSGKDVFVKRIIIE